MNKFLEETLSLKNPLISLRVPLPTALQLRRQLAIKTLQQKKKKKSQ